MGEEERGGLINMKGNSTDEIRKVDIMEQDGGLFIGSENQNSTLDNIVEEGGIEFEQSALRATFENKNPSQISTNSSSVEAKSTDNTNNNSDTFHSIGS